jgi:hypothetical protein
VRRLGLRDETEAAVRRAMRAETGMLVVEQVVPGGPATGQLQPGDVLLRIEPLPDAPHAAGAPPPPPDASRPARPTARSWAPSGWLGSESFCTTFLELEHVIDQSVNRRVCVSVQRGGVDLKLELLVQDLHALSPTVLLEVGGCSLHALSYQQARNWNLAPGSYARTRALQPPTR